MINLKYTNGCIVLMIALVGIMSPDAIAQSTDLSNIRKHYYDVKNMISSCNDEPSETDCGLYSNELELNSHGGQWRAVGNFSKKIQFWYDDDPANCDECTLEGRSVLRFVNIEEINSYYHSIFEYLFQDGKLIFYYNKNAYDDAEYRYYISNGEVIRFMKDKDIQEMMDEDQTRYSRALGESKKMQQLFILSHQ